MPDRPAALDALSVSDEHDPHTFSRRRFLQGALLAAAAGGARALLPGFVRPAAAATAGETVLVVLYAGGGQDTLSLFVPTDQYGAYQGLRAGLAIPSSSLVPITANLAMNTRVPYLKSLYDQGQVAVLQNVGHAEPTFSHFDSLAIWLNARAGVNRNVGAQDGWLGRWLDAAGGSDLTAVNIGAQVPLHLVGRSRRAFSLPGDLADPYGTNPTARWEAKVQQAIRDMAGATGAGDLADAAAAVAGLAMNLGAAIVPAYANVRAAKNAAGQPLARLMRDMSLAANLVNLDAGVRVIGVQYLDHDTHAGQPPRLNANLSDLNDAIEVLFATLAPTRRDRVVVMTFSEFGRAARANASDGCDHGTVSAMTLIGPLVRGGVYGEHPSLADLDGGSQLKFTSSSLDFRTPLASVVDGWLGGDVNDVFGASVPTLDLFGAIPTGAPITPPPAAGASPTSRPGSSPAPRSVAVDRPLDGRGLPAARRLSVGEAGAVSAQYGAASVGR